MESTDKAKSAAVNRFNEEDADRVGKARDLAEGRMGAEGAEQAEPPATENIQQSDGPTQTVHPDSPDPR